MGLVERVQRWMRGGSPTLVDYETYDQSLANPPAENMAPQNPAPQPTGPNFVPASSNMQSSGPMNLPGSGPANPVLGRVGPASNSNNPGGTYKIQQSYDALLQTVQDLRAALDGQARRQEEFFDRLSTLPAAAEALPQASKMQSDMLRMINDRLAMHADQQRKVQAVTNAVSSTDRGAGGGPMKKEYSEALQALREQIEMSNEIDRQLVESFNRFSMMIDRLQLANQHAVDALQQVRDSYAASAMQMHEWIEKSRHRGGWLVGAAFFMAFASLIAVAILIMRSMGH